MDFYLLEGERDMSQHKKKGMSKWLVVVLSIIVVVGFGATAYGVLKENNPMALYVTAEKNTMEEQWERMEQYNKHTLALQERMLQEAYETDASLKMNANAQGGQLNQAVPQLAMIQGILSTLELKMTSKVDPESSEMSGSLDVLLQGNSLAQGSFYQNKEKTAVKAPFLYDKYFALKNNELGAFMERMNQPTQGLTEIPNFVQSNSAAFTVDEMKEMAEEYVKAIGKHFDQDQFSLSKGASYEGTKYDKVTIDISEEKAQAMMKTMLEKLKNDERIWDVLDQQMKLQGMASGEQETLKENLETAIQNVDQVKLPNGIKIEAYIKDDIVAHETWTMDVKPNGEDAVNVAITSNYNKEAKNRYKASANVTLVPESEESKLKISYKEDGKPNKDGLHVDYNIGLDYKDQQEDLTANLLLNTDYTETSSNTDFELQLGGSKLGDQPVPGISGTFKSKTTKEDNNQYVQISDLGLDIAMNDPSMGNTKAQVEFHLEQDVSFTNDVSFPTLEGEEAVQVMEKSDEELEQISQEIQMNLQQYIGNFMGGLGGLGGF
ncbi:hypothetical protein N782_07570 [Pontibacillus yanchengensis Y32]|uniref:Uncharacterized protein n=2 Tax=Pontibacillus yanchengensis TaxID=462910 RepID=A0A0A2TBA0_9BACI|nr:hypothetical protein N782_07570 [Pontibacillus yanchengensis Y32]